MMIFFSGVDEEEEEEQEVRGKVIKLNSLKSPKNGINLTSSSQPTK